MKTTDINDRNNFMTVAEVKEYLNIGLTAAYELSHSKDFPVCRIGGTIRVPRDAFYAWVEHQTYIPTDLRPYLNS